VPSTPRVGNQLCLVPQAKPRASEVLRFKHLHQKDKLNILGGTGFCQARKEPCDPHSGDVFGPRRTTRARGAMASLHAAAGMERLNILFSHRFSHLKHQCFDLWHGPYGSRDPAGKLHELVSTKTTELLQDAVSPGTETAALPLHNKGNICIFFQHQLAALSFNFWATFEGSSRFCIKSFPESFTSQCKCC